VGRDREGGQQDAEENRAYIDFTPVAQVGVADYHSARFPPEQSLAMQKIGFAEALDSIVATDQRYQRDAYVFLRDALDYTTKQQKKSKGAAVRHVAGPELLEGVRLYALKEFGPMALTVFSYWGVERCEDIGQMVFNLIGAGIFGKTEQDSLEDFKSVYTFHEAFVKPFLPETAPGPAKLPRALPAPKVS
jgi:uncharacterized repeat protein (TIGR04138 family)